jgi:hypothetical protein
MPSNATSGRFWCRRSERTRSVRDVPSVSAARTTMPASSASSPMRLAASFSSPRSPNTPAIRPAFASLDGVVALVARIFA